MFKSICSVAKLIILLVSAYVLYVAFDAITNLPRAPQTKKTPSSENALREIIPQAQKRPLPKNTTLESKLKDCLGNRLLKISRNQNLLIIAISMKDNFTDNLIEVGWRNDAWKIFQIAYEDEKTRTDVMVQGLFPTQDAYGNTGTKIRGVVLLIKTEYQKINKDNFYPGDLRKIATYRFDSSGPD